MAQEIKKGEIIIYKDNQGPELQVQMDGETVWLTQTQMAGLFGKDIKTISEHILNVYAENELKRDKTTLKQANSGNSGIGLNRPSIYYNLDVIISVGYRVKSKRGTQFRVWATNRLRDFLVKGYAINEKRLKELENLQGRLKELESAHRLIHKALESKRLEGYEKELLKIISDYADTWFLLNAYDKGELSLKQSSKQKVYALDHEKLLVSITKFKQRLVKEKQAGELFGQESGGKFKAVLGSINQTFSGKELYPSVEEKAAHLLYFCIKDHPFLDGNKRIGSLVFLLFLVENRFLFDKKGERKISDNTLTALALLIAESKPQDKEVMVKLVGNLIS